MTLDSKKGFFSFRKKKAENSDDSPKDKGFFGKFSRRRKDEEIIDPLEPQREDSIVAEEPPEDSPTATEPIEPPPVNPPAVSPEPGKLQSDPPPKQGFLNKLRNGLKKTRGGLSGKLGGLFSIGRTIDEELLEEIEEMLIGADIGVQTTMEITDKVRSEVSRKTLKNGEELKQEIKKELLEILKTIPDRGFQIDRKPLIILVVGVNGAGKTTTIGKLANYFRIQGKTVLICAADTFRAAAVEQLQVWAQRAEADIVMKAGSKDPAAVVFEALERAKSQKRDVLLIDTAGRLHNNPNLMSELDKIHRIIGRSWEDAPHHVLLILDAVTGQNGLQQAKNFVEKVGASDLILTKLDGTAKGGIAIAIAKELNLPIQFIGVGEQMDDLLPFDREAFVHSLFEDDPR